MCNISRDEPISDNLNFFQSDKQEEDNVEFTMINPDLLDLDLEDGDHVNNALVASATVYFLLITYNNLLLPNQQFYEICSQLNEG